MNDTSEVKSFIYKCIQFFLQLKDSPCDLEDNSHCDLFNKDVQRMLMHVYIILIEDIKSAFLDKKYVCLETEENFVNAIKALCSRILNIADEDWNLFLYLVTIVIIAAITAVEKKRPEFVRPMADAVTEDIEKSQKIWIEQSGGWKSFLSFCKNLVGDCGVNMDSKGDANQSCLKHSGETNVRDMKKVLHSSGFYQFKVNFLSKFAKHIQHLVLASLQLQRDESDLHISLKSNEDRGTLSIDEEIEELEQFIIEQKNNHEEMVSDLSKLQKTLNSTQMEVDLLEKKYYRQLENK